MDAGGAHLLNILSRFSHRALAHNEREREREREMGVLDHKRILFKRLLLIQTSHSGDAYDNHPSNMKLHFGEAENL